MDVQEAIRRIRADEELTGRYSVRSLRLFGSIALGEGGTRSDVDILVEFELDAHVGLFEFARLQARLSELLARRVDLVTVDALLDALREQILREAVYAS